MDIFSWVACWLIAYVIATGIGIGTFLVTWQTNPVIGYWALGGFGVYNVLAVVALVWRGLKA